MSDGYWLMPPDKYKLLDDEFHFTFDPCPYPYVRDGIEIEWGVSSFVNPPFTKADAINGHGPTAFMRKAIEENKKGKTVVLVAPVPSYVNLMLDAGAELRSMGRIRWLHKETKLPCKDPSPITAFILRSRPNTPAPAAARKAREDVLDAIEEWRCTQDLTKGVLAFEIALGKKIESLRGGATDEGGERR